MNQAPPMVYLVRHEIEVERLLLATASLSVRAYDHDLTEPRP